MRNRGLGALLLAGLLAAPLAAQMQTEGYLDVFSARVKPEKRSDFDALSKKIADINRKNKGDNWLAYEIAYGEQNTVYFVSTRSTFAAAEEGIGAFMGAISKSLGPAGAAKLFQDSNNDTASARGEVRRRRWDLTANAPSDVAGFNKELGQARWRRVAVV